MAFSLSAWWPGGLNKQNAFLYFFSKTLSIASTRQPTPIFADSRVFGDIKVSWSIFIISFAGFNCESQFM